MASYGLITGIKKHQKNNNSADQVSSGSPIKSFENKN